MLQRNVTLSVGISKNCSFGLTKYSCYRGHFLHDFHAQGITLKGGGARLGNKMYITELMHATSRFIETDVFPPMVIAGIDKMLSSSGARF